MTACPLRDVELQVNCLLLATAEPSPTDKEREGTEQGFIENVPCALPGQAYQPSVKRMPSKADPEPRSAYAVSPAISVLLFPLLWKSNFWLDQNKNRRTLLAVCL